MQRGAVPPLKLNQGQFCGLNAGNVSLYVTVSGNLGPLIFVSDGFLSEGTQNKAVVEVFLLFHVIWLCRICFIVHKQWKFESEILLHLYNWEVHWALLLKQLRQRSSLGSLGNWLEILFSKVPQSICACKDWACRGWLVVTCYVHIWSDYRSLWHHQFCLC